MKIQHFTLFSFLFFLFLGCEEGPREDFSVSGPSRFFLETKTEGESLPQPQSDIHPRDDTFIPIGEVNLPQLPVGGEGGPVNSDKKKGGVLDLTLQPVPEVETPPEPEAVLPPLVGGELVVHDSGAISLGSAEEEVPPEPEETLPPISVERPKTGRVKDGSEEDDGPPIPDEILPPE